jgi:hypothetical protein
MTEPLIHIGYHKSGTTWLQEEVFCKSHLGFCTPWGHQSHLAIDHFVIVNPFRFDAAESRRQFIPGLESAAALQLVPVITHEDLCGYPVYGRYYGKEVAERLHATFPNARILIGIREQRSSLVSHYRQFLGQGESATIENFIGGAAQVPGFAPICRLDHFEYDMLVNHYRRLFGPDKVLVLPLELLRENMREYVDAIRGFVGIDGSLLPSARLWNVGWGGVTLKVLRYLNSYNIGLADWSRPRQSLTYQMVNKLCRFIDAVVPEGLHKKVQQQMWDYVSGRCGEYFVESNRKLNEMIGININKFDYML